MKQLTCKRVESILHEHLEGTLPEAERAAVEVHLAVCESCRASADLWSGISAAAKRADLGPVSPRLERSLAARDWSLGPERPSAGRRVLLASLIAVPAAAAASLALLLATGALDSNPLPATETSTGAAPSVADAPAPAPRAPALEEQRVGADRWRVFQVDPGSALWLADDAEVAIEQAGTDGVRFRLERGFALAEIQTLEPGTRFVVVTPDGEVEARGTVFSVEIAEDGTATARVTEGMIEVRRNAEPGATRLVGAGEQLVGGASEPRPATAEELARDTAFLEERTGRRVEVAVARPAPATNRGSSAEPAARLSPDDLVTEAHAQRKAGEFEAAATTYELVISRFPSSAAARNSLVALGQMELSAMRRPAEALAHFEDYLIAAPSGPLAAEARVGSVRALARLGRPARLIEAASDYLARHPSGHAAAEVTRTRGDARRAVGDCKGALADYATVLKTWPGTIEASRARSGTEACLDTSD